MTPEPLFLSNADAATLGDEIRGRLDLGERVLGFVGDSGDPLDQAAIDEMRDELVGKQGEAGPGS